MKIGDKYRIHCYKHDGKINQTSDEAIVVDIQDDYIVCINDKVKITESDGRSYHTREPAILFFYKERWFNIIAQMKPFGLFYYCNIGTPFLVDEDVIKYIDYDLDLRVFPSGGYKVLDKNEYKYHKKIMHYSDDIDFIAKKELESLIEMKKKNEGPFNKDIINKYSEKYLKIKN
jgi:hypothetical protein